VRNKFPLEMAEIHAPVIAADVNDDGKIEIITADAHGNVAAWTADGEEIWEVHLKSLIPQASFAHLLLKFVDGLLCNFCLIFMAKQYMFCGNVLTATLHDLGSVS
jgi:hypothetical protein